jgi:hypothetical protein
MRLKQNITNMDNIFNTVWTQIQRPLEFEKTITCHQVRKQTSAWVERDVWDIVELKVADHLAMVRQYVCENVMSKTKQLTQNGV